MSGSISLMDYAAQEKNPMRAGIVQKIVGESAFFRLLRFVTVDGLSYEYGEQATLGGIAFRNIGGTYDPSSGIVNPKREELKILGGIVSVDHVMAGSATHANAVAAKTRAAGLYYDWTVINGNPEVTGATNQFYGLKSRITGNQIIYPLYDGEADAGGLTGNGGVPRLADLDRLLDLVAGPNSSKVIIMSKLFRRAFKRAMLSYAGGATLADVASPLTSYEGARIEVLDEDDQTAPILPMTETRGLSTNTGSIYCIRPGELPEGEYVQGLVKSNMVEHKPLAQVNTQVQDLIEMVAGLGVFHGRAAARLAGCTESVPDVGD